MDENEEREWAEGLSQKVDQKDECKSVQDKVRRREG